MKEFERENIELLWEDDRWDGPLSGVCKIEDREYYFKLYDEHEVFWEDEDRIDEEIFDRVRWFLVYELTPEEMKIEHEQHKLFQEAIEAWGNDRQDLLDRFYKLRKETYKKPDFAKGKVIGWFIDD